MDRDGSCYPMTSIAASNVNDNIGLDIDTDRHGTDRPDERVWPQSPLLYDEGYYRNYQGGPYERGGHWTRFFGYIADEVVARWNPAVMLDAGCALGVFVEELRLRGIDAWGIDVSAHAIESVPAKVAAYCMQGSLADELPPGLPERFDLVSCIEVLEHMDRAQADKAIGRICAVTDRVLFSSTPDGYAEPTHFNCRPPEEWSAVFARHGLFREVETDASFLAPWAVVYSRRALTTFQAVLEFDRQIARLREENAELRRKIIEFDKKLDAAEAIDRDERVAQLTEQLLEARDQAAGAAAERARIGAHIREFERQAEERARAVDFAHVDRAIRRSLDWRVGNALLKPARAFRRLTDRVGARWRSRRSSD
jgi:Methyltransferase domain